MHTNDDRASIGNAAQPPAINGLHYQTMLCGLPQHPPCLASMYTHDRPNGFSAVCFFSPLPVALLAVFPTASVPDLAVSPTPLVTPPTVSVTP